MNGESPFFVGENPEFQLVYAVSYGTWKNRRSGVDGMKS